MKKHLICSSIATAALLLAGQIMTPAQVGRRTATSSTIAVPLPPPDDEPEVVRVYSAEETETGRVFACGAEEPRLLDKAEAEAQPEEVFTLADVTTKAAITEKPNPVYTREARMNGTRGRVRLRLLLSSTGDVTRVAVVRGLPDGLTRNAVAAACRVEFTPAVREGREVSQYVTLEYGFHMDDRPFFMNGGRPMRPIMRPLVSHEVDMTEALPSAACILRRLLVW